MSDPQELFCISLGELEPGQVSVAAPMARDAVRVHWFAQTEEFCALDVDIDPDSVSVTRTDGEGLQVNLYSDDEEDAFSPVFDEPVDEVIFRRLGGCIWAVEPEDIGVINLSGLQIFADLIGQHARTKQQKA